MNITCSRVFYYERHIPEQTLLYQLIDRHYPQFVEQLANQEKFLPSHVHKTFQDYLRCGRLKYGFIRVRCEDCFQEKLVAFSCKRRGFCPSCGAKRMTESAAMLADDIFSNLPVRQWVLSVPYPLRLLLAREPHVLSNVLGIIHRAISSFLIKHAGHTHKSATTGAVTLIQRFGSALNLNIHFHMLFVDAVFCKNKLDKAHLTPLPKLTPQSIQTLTETISFRVLRFLEKHGYIENDSENLYLNEQGLDPNTLESLQGHSITYRIAVGPNQGQKVMMLRTLPAHEHTNQHNKTLLGKTNGFSLHAGVSARASQRKKIERLCRYITRPAVSVKRLSLTPSGKVRYRLKTPYSNGTTHVIFEPIDFIARLASLVPPPRANLTRFHGVFAPNSKFRSTITKKNVEGTTSTYSGPPIQSIKKKYTMTWMARLKRVFNIDMNICGHCGGKVKVIAWIENQVVIDKILDHIADKNDFAEGFLSLPRAPPLFLHQADQF